MATQGHPRTSHGKPRVLAELAFSGTSLIIGAECPLLELRSLQATKTTPKLV